jgi:hypothetical protein
MLVKVGHQGVDILCKHVKDSIEQQPPNFSIESFWIKLCEDHNDQHKDMIQVTLDQGEDD